MKNYKTNILMFICLVLIFTTPAAASVVKGELTRQNFVVGNCRVSQMTVIYSFGLLLGEPTVDGTFKWEAGAGTSEKCIDPRASIFIKVISNNTPGYIELRPAIPKAGAGFGFSTTGSPDWKKFIRKTQPPSETYHSDAVAKSFYKAGFVVDSFVVVSRDKKTSTFKKEKETPVQNKDSFWDISADKNTSSQPKDQFWSVETAEKTPKPVKIRKIVKKTLAESGKSSAIKLTDGFWGCTQKNAWNQPMYYDLKFLENGRCIRYLRLYPTKENCSSKVGQTESINFYPYKLKGKDIILAGFKNWIPEQHLVFTGKSLIVKSAQDIETDQELKYFPSLQTPCGCQMKKHAKASKAFCKE